MLRTFSRILKILLNNTIETFFQYQEGRQMAHVLTVNEYSASWMFSRSFRIGLHAHLGSAQQKTSPFTKCTVLTSEDDHVLHPDTL